MPNLQAIGLGLTLAGETEALAAPESPRLMRGKRKPRASKIDDSIGIVPPLAVGLAE